MMTFRIAVIAYEFPSGADDAIVSGEVKNPYTLATQLQRHGHEVVVVSVPYLRRTKVSGHWRKCDQLDVLDAPEGSLRGVLRTISRVHRVAKTLRSLDPSSFDVIHAQGPALALGAHLAQQSTHAKGKTPVVVTAHGTNLPEAYADQDGGWRQRLRAWNARLDLVVDRLGFQRSSAVIAVSQFQLAEMEKVYRVPSRTTRVIYNGVDLVKYSVSSTWNMDHVLFVGRLAPKKGVAVLLKAISLLIPQFPSLTCTIVGGSNLFDTCGDELKSLARTEGLDHLVSWLDSVAETELASIYRSASVAVFPSLNYESLPTVALEAMACGIPVVATDQWGTPEALGQNHPGLVPQGSPELLASAITRLLTDDDLRRSVISDQLSRVAAFSSQHLAAAHEAVYHEVTK